METRPIHLNTKMSDVVHRNYMVIPILDRFGIRLGFGDKTVKEVCEKVGVDPCSLVELLNAYTNADYIPSDYVKKMDVLALIDYLKQTHSNYLEEWVVNIESMIEDLKRLGEDERYTDLILNFFKGYRSELTTHIEREERIVFPYIKTLHEVIESGAVSAEKREVIDSYSMKEFEEDHDDIAMKLKDLKNIMIKYIISPENTMQYYAIIQELFKLEEDVEYHTRVEDKILIPRVIFMEDKIKKIIQ
ncbi:regulator of cell morphogenesis and NO signaling [Balneicella halophila]|uniref:Regulator of cell morphogenesis and NO signaling n=1 Tax=Balneicella halophila TaxID=1537566 RepID=A0A7L4URG8_BALHA|nr:hemerythrin domain-containing protein [Balneicella halophila]PVX52365.1 regulator of cell morphogenesis and NO signaling [Balneicella halophila]